MKGEKEDRKRAVAHTNWPSELNICSRAGKYPTPVERDSTTNQYTKNWKKRRIKFCCWVGTRCPLALVGSLWWRCWSNKLPVPFLEKHEKRNWITSSLPGAGTDLSHLWTFVHRWDEEEYWRQFRKFIQERNKKYNN
jgi:hypothetical protein